jgi:CDP-ribitol ribitolphosphotransferase
MAHRRLAAIIASRMQTPAKTSPPVPDQGPAPAARLVSLDWERIQLIIRLRPLPLATLAPQDLRLQRHDRPAVTVAPTRTWREDDVLVARFNVMLGPDQMPLDVGRWALALADGGTSPALPLRLTASGSVSVDPLRDGKAFLLWRGRYEVVPKVRPEDGALELTVRMDPGAGRQAEESLPVRIGRVFRRMSLGARVAVLRFLVSMMRLVPQRNGRRILFISDYGTDLTDNLRLIRDRMVERGLDREFELLALTKPALTARRGLLDRLRLPWLLARADTIVIDKDQPVLHRVSGSHHRIIQLWHASGAIKTVGYSRIGTPHGPSPWSSVHKNYRFAIVSGEHDVPLYAEAFGIPEEWVLPTGIPRMDRFFDARAREEGRRAALAALPGIRDRTVILFAPTFRGLLREATYDLDVLDYARLHALCLEKDAVFVIRLHPQVRQSLGIPPSFADRLLDGSSRVMNAPDLLFATDLLITDYSSIVFEYSTLGRPMLFFAYDLEGYKAERDVYVPYEAFVPGKIVRTFDELVEAIRNDDYDLEKVAPFAARHFAHPEGGATDRVVDLITGR